MNRLLCAMLLTMMAMPVAAELYRWTDENGRVHFGDRPPEEEDHAAEQIEVQQPKPIGQGTDLQQINERLQELRDQESERTERQEARAESRAQAREEACEEARDRHVRLGRRFLYRREDGDTYSVSTEEAARDREELKQWIDENC